MAKNQIIFESNDTEVNRLEGLVCHILEENPQFAHLHAMIYACVEELLVNCMKHGNKYDPKKKVICQYAVKEDELEFTLQDEGEGFNLEEAERIREAKGDEREDGRGMIIARSVSDHIEYEDGGRRVRVLFKSGK